MGVEAGQPFIPYRERSMLLWKVVYVSIFMINESVSI